MINLFLTPKRKCLRNGYTSIKVTYLSDVSVSLYIHIESIRYGCRNVTVVGSVMASIGFLAAAFSNNIYLLYLFFGVIAGCGLSLCYVASIIIVAYYFDRRRSFATGISVCGSGVGESLVWFVFEDFETCLLQELSSLPRSPST